MIQKAKQMESSVKMNEKQSNGRMSIPVPHIIVYKIESEFNVERTRQKAILVIQSLIYRYQSTFTPMLEFLPASRKYKNSLLGTDDYPIWGRLVQLGILEEFKFPNGRTYSTAGSRCKRYRIDPELLSSNVSHIPYSPRDDDAVVNRGEMVDSLHQTLKKLSNKK